MATKRRRIPPRKINERTPAWAMQLLAGERPDRNDPEVEAGLFGWLLDDHVPGLPSYSSEAGQKLRDRVGGL
jgi:hypothetical protein